MGAIVCELCGSNDVVKKDGVYVCQHCGTKYTLDEARKLIGTVKVDKTDSIDNYLQMAKTAFDSRNSREAELYCNKVIEIDATNYQAWLYKGLAAGWQSTLANSRINEAYNCFIKCLQNAPESEIEGLKKRISDEIGDLLLTSVYVSCNNYEKNASVENADVVITTAKTMLNYAESFLIFWRPKCKLENLNPRIAKLINDAAINGYYQDIKKDYWGITGHPSEVAWRTYRSRSLKAVELLEYAISLMSGEASTFLLKTLDNEYNKQICVCYENIIDILKEVEPSGSYTISDGMWVLDVINTAEQKQNYINKIIECQKKIKELDPSYEMPEPPKPTKVGCYVATAVYGSYDCPEVWTLRRYRDYTLAETWYGRLFIFIYYAISPTLVKWFGETQWFKNMWKPKLDRMVKKLNETGVADTPYQDRNW